VVLGVPLTFISIYISFYQGTIVYKEKTGPVAEAVVIFLLSMVVVLIVGVASEAFPGVFVASAASTIAHLGQGLWLTVGRRQQRLPLTDCPSGVFQV
jgi:hypothetical protein